ncbi:alpha/beta fold hydrolase [Aeromicrobium sp. CF4.19]|uniref:alpha/beta fold hydrolase n=1 Tax=Aeromicrobium sp. CF4.19 TaxID=3373082 RepID=UPI003EE7E6BD
MVGRRGRRAGALVVAAALGLVAVATVASVHAFGDDAVEITETTLSIPAGPEPDGAVVELDASVFVPAADAAGADRDGRRAAVVLTHGFGGSKESVADQAREVAADGYVVLTYTARGFGASGGLIHLDSPDFEVADVSAMIDVLAARDDVRLDGAGDPRVGIAGASYGGAVTLMAAGSDDRVDAIVPAITWNDLGQSLFPQNAAAGDDASPRTPAASTPAADAGVFKRRWASLLFASGLGGAPAGPGATGTEPEPDIDPSCGRFADDVCAVYQDVATSGRPTEAALDLLGRSSPAPLLDRVTAPTLIVQGLQDSLFGLDQADANARGIAVNGTTVAVHWIDGGHDGTGADAAGSELTEPALAWFDHHLRGGDDPGDDFTFVLPQSILEDGAPEQLSAPDYATSEELDLALTGDPHPVLSPPGGEPAAVTSLPGTGPLLSAASGVGGAGYALAVLPGQSAAFGTEPLESTTTVVGSPRVRLSVTSTTTDATLFVSAWVADADGTAALPRQLVSPVRLEELTPGQAREVDVALPASVYRIERDQTLRIVVSSTDAAYAVPNDARTYRVALTDAAAVQVPVVDAQRAAGTGALAPTPLVVAVALLALAAAGTMLWSRRRHRPTAVVDDLREVPLAVNGLVKEYASGFRAVDGVTWRAERGQVVGLLGPNGAGKTTTMRMLVGLMKADEGTVHVLGREVTAGAPVLARVGALIEGPGFLPHLSGRANLHAYWAATGRSDDEAGVEEALATADLGAAAERPVRSYSQGMRQRLGIAQAMLGLPELLLLDEPTNGLDPPQIRAMRGILARYAAGGRTVVVSSHLLSEVEQTCSHVVVMHRGRVVLEGAVADLVQESGSTLVSVEGGDPDAAAEVLRPVEGVSDVEVEPDGRLRVRGTVERPRLVATLVENGVPVSSVDGRRHLEEVFMALVGGGEPAQVEQEVPS